MCNRVAIIIENYPLLIGRSNAHKKSKIIESMMKLAQIKLTNLIMKKKKKDTRRTKFTIKIRKKIMNNHNYVFLYIYKTSNSTIYPPSFTIFLCTFGSKKLHNMLIYIITFVRGYIICNWIDNINSTNGV